MNKLSGQVLGLLLILVGAFFSGWIYMMVISLFNPISFKNAFMISFILNIIGLTFNHARSVNNDR